MDCTSPVYGYPCGKCPNCRARSRQEWIFRLRMEYKSCNFGLFVTLTYDDDHLPSDGVCIRDIQLFVKRLRKHFDSQALRYFIVSEYGDHTARPHYHALMFFNFPRKIDIYDTIESTWQNGNVQFGEIEEGSIVYCTKYCLKGSDVPPGMTKNFRLVSKMHGGIGADYIELQPTEDLTRPQMARYQGEQAPMPRYYREKQIKKLPAQEVAYIRDEYQKNLYELRSKRLIHGILKSDGNDIYERQSNYYKHLAECNVRKAELYLKRTKKQNKW